MRRWVVLAISLGLALAAPDFGRWYPFSEAQALAQAHGRLLLVYFHSPACPYCDQMNTFVLSDPQVDALLRGRYVVASVSTAIPEGQNLARRFRVLGVPSFVFLVHRRGTWEEVGRFFGSRPRAQFLEELRRMCAKGGACG
ncbi:thioredoxin fold domain-containing protein [Thermus sediminis]|uniref:thioredoxin fold domain-containing protein n=1 Tax=Thermus sediminis TaxID=1761908 RepID=UPI000E3E5A9D|nr:thioredoxin family protein [Thermus sediminis]